MVLFEIPTIEPSEVFTSRSKRVRISNPTFQGLDVFFKEMLVEHWSRWFDEAECIVKIVAQMFRVLSWWSFSEKQGCGGLEHKNFQGKFWSFCLDAIAERR